jgi:hypothetical protein
MCEQDVADNNASYWVCIDERMNQGPITFERFVLSSHVCDASPELIGSND